MFTIDDVRQLVEVGLLKGNYQDYRVLRGKTKYRAKGKKKISL